MSDNIMGDNFYGHKEGGWHGKGFVTTQIMTAKQVLEVMKIAEVRKLPHMVAMNGEIKQFGYDLVRGKLGDEDEQFFGYVSDDYNELQPLDFAELFDENVGEPVETLGFLGKGEQMFITWRLPSFDVTTGDTIELFGFIPIGFNGKIGARIYVVTIRVVCQNTWNAAISQAEGNEIEGRGMIWSGRHNSPTLKEDLGEWLKFTQKRVEREQETLKNFFTRLLEVECTEMDARYYANEIWPDPASLGHMPERFKERKEKEYLTKLVTIQTIREGVMEMFLGKGTAITPTLYGFFNAGTEFFNRGWKSKKDPTESILLGGRHKHMNEMAHYLLKLI